VVSSFLISNCFVRVVQVTIFSIFLH
ncbi:putative membrane domain protein, partial [Chlamydia psittaci 84-8471/1]